MKVKVVSLEKSKAGSIDLEEAIFGLPIRSDILQRMVTWQLAKRRSGTHKTKGVSEIRGTTAKPHKQKGTGRARAGTRRAPQMRGGAVIFGPVVRDHSHKLPKKVRRLALKTALSAKLAEGKLEIVEELKLTEIKTSMLARKFSDFGWNSALFIDSPDFDTNFSKATANLPNIDVVPESGINVYDILRRDTLVLTKSAVEILEARLK